MFDQFLVTDGNTLIWRGLGHMLADHFGQFGEVWFWVFHIVAALSSMLLPYCLGSINPAVLISKKMYGADIRKYGNGNPDAGNMLVVCDRRAALMTLAFDLAKACLASFLGLALWGFNGRALAGFFVIFGHMFPIFHGMVGGRGVACWSMIVLLLSPITFVILLVIMLVGAIGTRMSAFGAMLTALLYPLILQAFYWYSDMSVAMAVLTTVFVFVANRESIKRILNGKEPKIDLSRIKAKLLGKE